MSLTCLSLVLHCVVKDVALATLSLLRTSLSHVNMAATTYLPLRHCAIQNTPWITVEAHNETSLKG